MHLFVIPAWINFVLVSATTALAIWKGGWRERVIAGVQQLQMFRSYVLCETWSCPAWSALADDGVMLAACVACALRGDRYWTIPASSFALLAVITDLLAARPDLSLWVRASADLVWMYLLSAAILWGVWSSARARARAAAAPPLPPVRRRVPTPSGHLDRSSP
ncbi:MAG: hypothetical protein E7812_14060 [Phenylobacterium sp.]|nr:MAG: hypothetical protein E7812_14060 [Phenylobacterium sp.]